MPILLGAMKFKYSACCLISAAVVGGVSCKEKPKTTESGEIEEKSIVENVVEDVKEAVTGQSSTSLSADERAAKLGFSQYLPKDTEMVLSVYNAEQAGEQLKALELYGVIAKYMNADMVEELQEPQIEIEEEMLEDENVVPPDAEQGPEDGEFEQGEMEGGQAHGLSSAKR